MKNILLTLLLAFSAACFGVNVNTGKEESQILMDAVLPLAEKLLSENGEFFPYGGAMLTNGDIVSVAAYDGDDHPPSVELITMLQQV